MRELGTLYLTGRGTRPSDAAFVPSAPFSVCMRVLRMACKEPLRSDLPRLESVALDDLRRFGALGETTPGVYVGATTPEQFELSVDALLRTEPYTTYWDLLIAGATYQEALATAFGLDRLAPSTRTWLGNRLANWGRRFGHLPPRKADPSERAQVELFGEMPEHAPTSGRPRRGSLIPGSVQK